MPLMGPISKDDSKSAVVNRLIALLNLASEENVELVVYPELALTFFPRWLLRMRMTLSWNPSLNQYAKS